MGRPRKYCYAILQKETGEMLLEDGKLPIYWDKGAATNRAKRFQGYCLQKIELSEIEWFVLHPHVTSKQTLPDNIQFAKDHAAEVRNK